MSFQLHTSSKMEAKPLSMDSHSQDSQRKLIEHFIKILNRHQKQDLESDNFSKHMSSIENLLKDLGVNERDFKPCIRDILSEVRKLLFSASPASSSAEAFEIGMSLTGSSPLSGLIGVASSIVDDITKKEIVKCQLQNFIGKVKQKNSNLVNVKGDVRDTFEKEVIEAEKRNACLIPEKQEILACTSQFYEQELKRLKEIRGEKKPLSCEDIKEMLQRHETSKQTNTKLKTELDSVSRNNSLPANLPQAHEKLAELKTYLEALLHQISNYESVADVSISSSVFS